MFEPRFFRDLGHNSHIHTCSKTACKNAKKCFSVLSSPNDSSTASRTHWNTQSWNQVLVRNVQLYSKCCQEQLINTPGWRSPQHNGTPSCSSLPDFPTRSLASRGVLIPDLAPDQNIQIQILMYREESWALGLFKGGKMKKNLFVCRACHHQSYPPDHTFSWEKSQPGGSLMTHLQK